MISMGFELFGLIGFCMAALFPNICCSSHPLSVRTHHDKLLQNTPLQIKSPGSLPNEISRQNSSHLPPKISLRGPTRCLSTMP
mmetsp:Transcript_28544/g.59999  ORF Transcript_28544/g.59999 Transcript_28544/m.59999 type:complete len:83 (+) Transcript_28544:153-401(+)